MSFAPIVQLLRVKLQLKTLSTFVTARHVNLVMGQLTLTRASLDVALKALVKPTWIASNAFSSTILLLISRFSAIITSVHQSTLEKRCTTTVGAIQDAVISIQASAVRWSNAQLPIQGKPCAPLTVLVLSLPTCAMDKLAKQTPKTLWTMSGVEVLAVKQGQMKQH